MKRTRQVGRSKHEQGNTILISVLLITVLGALAAAQVAVVHKNAQASRYFESHSDLHKYAESGIELALYDLRYEISGDDGIIGVKNWNVSHDHGKDGVSNSNDEGEEDGLPTPGEPNVNPVPIGSQALGAGLIVYVNDTAFANVKHVVATATNGDASATVDTFARQEVITIPRVGAVYVDPDVVLDLKGNAFVIDGNDHDIAGNPVALPPMPGLSTSVGSTPGDNEALLLAQVPAAAYDQVLGQGGTPSVEETVSVDVNTMFDDWMAVKTQEVVAGTHSDLIMGSLSEMQVTYVSGDLHLTGAASGSGVLLIDGSLTLTGEFTFHGLVIVRGDVRLSGGGATKHVIGTMMVSESVTALDEIENVSISGTADMVYCSEILNRLEDLSRGDYVVVFYEER